MSIGTPHMARSDLTEEILVEIEERCSSVTRLQSNSQVSASLDASLDQESAGINALGWIAHEVRRMRSELTVLTKMGDRDQDDIRALAELEISRLRADLECMEEALVAILNARLA